MKKDKEYYIEKYVELCGSLCKVAEDYTRAKVRKHNRAMKQLISMEKELREDVALEKEVYAALLSSGDECVRQTAAGCCLKCNLHIERAVEVLEEIRSKGERMAAMGAEFALGVWRGEIDPRKPV